MFAGSTETTDNHLPENMILEGLPILSIKIKPYAVPSSNSIPYAMLPFSDSNKDTYVFLIQQPVLKDVTYILY